MASQFKELLKKDIRLTLSKRALIPTVIAPVIFIIIITLLPAFLIQQNTIEVTIVNHDSFVMTNSSSIPLTCLLWGFCLLATIRTELVLYTVSYQKNYYR